MTRVDVVTGFLGAGKTTFIGAYLRWLRIQGIRCCVIENEFGRAGVDRAILAEEGARVKEISGGCVCCTLKVTLYDLLQELSDTVDRIILEPSGLFCGDDFVEILGTPALQKTCKPGFWAGIVDPASIDRLNQEQLSVLYSELVYSSDILLSKTQMHGRDQIDSARSFTAKLLPPPGVRIHDFTWTDENLHRLFPSLLATKPVLRPHERKQFDHSNMFQSATFYPQSVFTKETLRPVLERLMADAGILRIKGFVGGKNGGFLVNCVPGRIHVQEAAFSGSPMLNIIGQNIDRMRIKTTLSGDENHKRENT